MPRLRTFSIYWKKYRVFCKLLFQNVRFHYPWISPVWWVVKSNLFVVNSLKSQITSPQRALQCVQCDTAPLRRCLPHNNNNKKTFAVILSCLCTPLKGVGIEIQKGSTFVNGHLATGSKMSSLLKCHCVFIVLTVRFFLFCCWNTCGVAEIHFSASEKKVCVLDYKQLILRSVYGFFWTIQHRLVEERKTVGIWAGLMDRCASIFTETCLHHNIKVMQLGVMRGGGLCADVSDALCSDKDDRRCLPGDEPSLWRWQPNHHHHLVAAVHKQTFNVVMQTCIISLWMSNFEPKILIL